MNFAEYTKEALRTKAPNHVRDWTMMGLFGEAGEIVDLIKKIVAHGHPITDELRAKMRKEIGDTLWYVAIGYEEDNDKGHRAVYFIEQTSLQPMGDLAFSDAALKLRGDVHNVEEWGFSEAAKLYQRVLDDLAVVARLFNTTLEQCAIENVAKLRERYPDGFSTEASIARVDVVKGTPFDEQLELPIKPASLCAKLLCFNHRREGAEHCALHMTVAERAEDDSTFEGEKD